MQNKPKMPWREVLAALYRAGKVISLEELTELVDRVEIDVMNSLNFLQKQGWAECQLDDGTQWVCTVQARSVLDSMHLIPATVVPPVGVSAVDLVREPAVRL